MPVKWYSLHTCSPAELMRLHLALNHGKRSYVLKE